MIRVPLTFTINYKFASGWNRWYIGVIFGTMCRFSDNRKDIFRSMRGIRFIYFIVSEKLRPKREKDGRETGRKKIRLLEFVASKCRIYITCI